MVHRVFVPVGLVLVVSSVVLQFLSFFYQTGFISGYKLSIVDSTGAVSVGLTSLTSTIILLTLIAGIAGTALVVKGIYRKR